MALQNILGRRDVISLAFGAMIGWGWVILSGPLIAQAGTLGSILAVILASAMVGCVGLAYAELTSAMPRAGGELAFTFRALGPGVSWVCGWALILAYVGVCAFEAVALSSVVNYLNSSFSQWPLFDVVGTPVYLSWILLSSAGAIFIGYINWKGIQTAAWVQWVAMAGLVAVGLSFFVAAQVTGSVSNLEPRWHDLRGLLRAAMLMPFLLIGFDVIPQAAEEISVPRREIGKLLMLSIGMATVWYLLVQWSVGVSMTESARQGSTLVTADAAAHAFRSAWGGKLLVLGGLLGVLTSWNAFFVGATRLVYAMGRAGMLPRGLQELHPKHNTPSRAVLFMLACTLVAPWLGAGALVWIANAASFAAVLAFCLVTISFLRLRQTEPEMDRPYLVPGGNMVPYIAVAVSIGFVCLYLPFSPSALIWPEEWLIVVVWAALGVAVYLVGKKLQPPPSREEQRRILLDD